jgi:hypothetical protein
MARKLVPFTLPQQQSSRPVTLKRFDIVVSALSSLLELSGAVYARDLNALILAVAAQMSTHMFGDPAAVRSIFQRRRRFWVDYLRSNKDTALMIL